MDRSPIRPPGPDTVALLAWIVAATPPDLALDPAYVEFPRVRLPDGRWTLGRAAPPGRPRYNGS